MLAGLWQEDAVDGEVVEGSVKAVGGRTAVARANDDVVSVRNRSGGGGSTDVPCSDVILVPSM